MKRTRGREDGSETGEERNEARGGTRRMKGGKSECGAAARSLSATLLKSRSCFSGGTDRKLRLSFGSSILDRVFLLKKKKKTSFLVSRRLEQNKVYFMKGHYSEE